MGCTVVVCQHIVTVNVRAVKVEWSVLRLIRTMAAMRAKHLVCLAWLIYGPK